MSGTENVRVALVTGAASGIGRATTDLLVSRGAVVGALDLAAVAQRPGVEPLVADVTDAAAVDHAIDAFGARHGRVDVLANNAGTEAVGAVQDNTDDEWLRVLDVNVVGMARVTRAALPYLRMGHDPAIVNTCSAAAFVGLAQRALYSASKGAVYSLTLAMATDLLTDGIRVTCVCPGTIDTAWVSRLVADADDPEAARAGLAARQPLGRLGRAEEIAEAIAFLSSPGAAFLTGSALVVDGGVTHLRPPAPAAR